MCHVWLYLTHPPLRVGEWTSPFYRGEEQHSHRWDYLSKVKQLIRRRARRGTLLRLTLRKTWLRWEVGCASFFLVVFNVFNVYLLLREKECKWRRSRERDRQTERIPSRLQAPSQQHRARCRARTHEPWDDDLSRSGTLNRLNHPGDLGRAFFEEKGRTYGQVALCFKD